MEDKHFNPLADLTAREHEVLRMIARELLPHGRSRQASDLNLSPDCEDYKAEPASGSLSSTNKLND